jgi:[acyl-carrier-protein] S-malonyltransferase
MAAGLCEALPAAKKLFDKASALLGYDLLAVCASGPKERLDSTVVSQPAIYVASLAALEQLKQAEPDSIGNDVTAAGLSLGEYTALTFAGALTFADGVRLVKERGESMQAASEARSSGMISVLMLEKPQIDSIVEAASARGLMRIANYLCPGNLALSGDLAACDEVERLASEAGGRTARLAVAGAFHTPIMQPAVERLTAALANVNLSPPRIPVWSNVTGKPHGSVEEIKSSLARQVVEPVRWEEIMRGLLESGCERFYEVGPGRVLAGLLKRVQRKVDCRNVTA